MVTFLYKNKKSCFPAVLDQFCRQGSWNFSSPESFNGCPYFLSKAVLLWSQTEGIALLHFCIIEYVSDLSWWPRVHTLLIFSSFSPLSLSATLSVLLFLQHWAMITDDVKGKKNNSKPALMRKWKPWTSAGTGTIVTHLVTKKTV